jgi:hypothetical protein
MPGITYLDLPATFALLHAAGLLPGVAYIAIVVLCPWFATMSPVPLLVPVRLLSNGAISPPNDFAVPHLVRIIINQSNLHTLIMHFLANTNAAPRNRASGTHSINHLRQSQGMLHLLVPRANNLIIRSNTPTGATFNIRRDRLMTRDEIVACCATGDLPANVMGGFQVEIVLLDDIRPGGQFIESVYECTEDDDQFFVLNDDQQDGLIPTPVHGVFRTPL